MQEPDTPYTPCTPEPHSLKPNAASSRKCQTRGPTAKPQALNPRPENLKPRPQALNPKPEIPHRINDAAAKDAQGRLEQTGPGFRPNSPGPSQSV